VPKNQIGKAPEPAPSGSSTHGDVVVLINTVHQIMMALKIAGNRRFTYLIKVVSWLMRK
jgi:hypothetical protein